MEQKTTSIRGWTVVLAAVSINLILGVLYAWGVTGKALVAQWHWSKADAALPFTVSTVAFALTMIFAGRAQDKIGPRYVAMLGGLLLGLGMVASSWAKSPEVMMVTFGVLGGMGIGVGYSATTPPSIKWFPPARKGLIAGLVVAGVGLASVWIAPLTRQLLDTVGISTTFLILGGGTIVIVGTLAQLLKAPPAGFQPTTPAPTAAKPLMLRRELDWPQMLRTPTFYLLWFAFILAAAPGLLLLSNAATIAGEQALANVTNPAEKLAKAAAIGTTAVMVLAIFNTSGRVVGGFVSDLIGRRNTMVLAFLLQTVNMLLFRYYTSPGLLLFGVGFAGVCYGTIFTLFPAATADYFGVRNLGVNYGLLFTAFGVAGVSGSLLGGRVRDVLGNFDRSYLICAGMLGVAALLAAITRPPVLAAAPVVKPAEEPVSV
jgi:MFS transporter, OFA family, oxalate/formate antiporter